MRIIYLFTSPSLNGSSVQTKVLNQIKYLNLAGAACRGAFFSTEVKEVTSFNEHVDFIPVENCQWKYFNRIGLRRNLDKVLKNYITQNYKSTDIFYFRYPGASKRLYYIAMKYGDKIVSEHQSKEIDEIESFKSENPFGLKPTKFLSWFLHYRYPVYNENKWGNRFVGKIKSVVSITNEIATYQKNKGAKNVLIAPNGIDVREYKVRSKPNFELPIKVLFLKGTASNSLWNGLERIIESIEKLEKPVDSIKLIICGHNIEGELPEKDYIEHLGYLEKNELDLIIDSVHIGVSTMALYKKNLKEAAVLKTREYFARGLPFIYAYTDPDLNDEAQAFALHFPNDDSMIDMEKVIDFTQKVLADKVLPQKMRNYAEVHLDNKVKMKRLLESLYSL